MGLHIGKEKKISAFQTVPPSDRYHNTGIAKSKRYDRQIFRTCIISYTFSYDETDKHDSTRRNDVPYVRRDFRGTTGQVTRSGRNTAAEHKASVKGVSTLIRVERHTQCHIRHSEAPHCTCPTLEPPPGRDFSELRQPGAGNVHDLTATTATTGLMAPHPSHHEAAGVQVTMQR